MGKNAQGKTNILEAIYMCTCARSHRTGDDTALIRQGADSYDVRIEFDTDQGAAESLRIRYTREGGGQRARRDIYYQDVPLDKIGDFCGIFHAVIFAPEDVMLVKEGPSGRRRYLDLLMSQVSPGYFRDLQTYSKLLQQRNHLLKTIRDLLPPGKAGREAYRRFDPDVDPLDPLSYNLLNLSVWDEKIAETGADILRARNRMIKRIEAIADESMQTISDQQESMRIKYKSVANVDVDGSATEVFEQYLQRLYDTREDDIFRGNTANGPHRDDLDISLNDTLIKKYASQGQMRSVVLSLKLAELRVVQEETGQTPVLLLDDVMSDLDGQRRTHLLSVIEEHQVLITCTDLQQIFPQIDDASELDDLADITLFTVDKGTVKA